MTKTPAFLLLTALLLSPAAHATTGTATQMGAQASAAAQADAQISSAALLDAQGRVVATADAAGTFVFQGASRAATQARVTLRSGASATYRLAGNVAAQGRVSAETLVVASSSKAVSLTQAVRADAQAQASARAAAAAALAGRTVTLVNAQGQVVGILTASGIWQAQGDLSGATRAVVTTGGGVQSTFDLAAQASADARGQLDFGRLTVRTTSGQETLTRVLVSGPVNVSVQGEGAASGSGQTSGSAGGASGSAQGGVGVGVNIGVGTGIGIGIGGGK
ncbi:hypothetical protein [Deinococcus aquaedulcis]|uniref:hypothetical protein n=1 Tax=Deinococcus aquaedulcis TaxID=2840455 RepID=UPI001C82FAAE|nr:hypothetical protein [Deinococcus aquaedulcis]